VVHALLECDKALAHRRQLGSTDHTQAVGMRHDAGDQSCQVRGFREAEHHTAHVAPTRIARCHDVLRGRVSRGNGARRVLKLEPVSEDEIEVLVSVLAEILLELRRGLRLNVADLSAE